MMISCGFMSIVINLAQDDNFDIQIFHLLHTFICWPSIAEALIISFILWSFRYVERLLGEKSLFCFLLNNFIVFFPVFCVIIRIAGIKHHFSFLFFIPCSLFVFMVWRIPSTPIYKNSKLNDKVIITILFSIESILQFPFSFLCLLSSSFGYYFWVNDSFKIRRVIFNICFNDTS